jgi:hypothetical protein
MPDTPPIACSLGADPLRQRLDEIAALAADSLQNQTTEGDTQILHFLSDPTTRRRLEEIVAAEAECCPFLDLQLTEEGNELILRVERG